MFLPDRTRRDKLVVSRRRNSSLSHVKLPIFTIRHAFLNRLSGVRIAPGVPLYEAKYRIIDHSSLAVTIVYLRRLEGEQDKSWVKVAEANGL